jgi:hypothetical protein
MSTPWDRLESPAKWLVICIAVLLVSSGLCGLQLLANSGPVNNGSLIPVLLFTGILEIVVMGISAFGTVLMLIIWLLSLLNRRNKD